MTTAVGQAVAVARELLGDRVEVDRPLAPLTTYRVGGPAALFVDVGDVDDLVRVARARARTGLPLLVIGRGSNLLVADEGFAGIVVSIAGFGDSIAIPTPDPDGTVVVTAGGGVALPVLARRTAAAGVTGFEWAVGVPGSVGGAVRMNAGGHGSDIAASLVDAVVLDLDRDPDQHPDGPLAPLPVTVPAAELGLGFRSSDLTDAMVVLSARFALRAGDPAEAERTISEIVRWRREHQPGGQNCGSVFVNPVPGEVAAGALIDAAGLRGLRIGTAWVSEKHANFVQAAEGGRAADVRAVIEAVRERVAATSGWHLRSEVRMVGFPIDGAAR